MSFWDRFSHWLGVFSGGWAAISEPQGSACLCFRAGLTGGGCWSTNSGRHDCVANVLLMVFPSSALSSDQYLLSWPVNMAGLSLISSLISYSKFVAFGSLGLAFLLLMVWDVLSLWDVLVYWLLVYRNTFLYFVRLGMKPKALCISDEHCTVNPYSKLYLKRFVY